MKIIKKVFKYVLYGLSVPLLYLVISLILSILTVDRINNDTSTDKSIYLNTNGVHLDIVIPKSNIDSSLLSLLEYTSDTDYLSFGWGDENFYINTPTWGDLTFKNAYTALFLKSKSLIHLTRYNQKRSDWVEVKVNATELRSLNQYLLNSFMLDNTKKSILLKDKGYSARDDFYKAVGSYSCFNTCNSWVNTGFKKSGLKSCAWTPFDFALINKYE